MFGGGTMGGLQWAQFILPLWMPAAAFAMLPLCWTVRIYQARRRQQALAGVCSTCGYDLRATPERCPECGAIPLTTDP
jgi:hypothetical protein